MSLKSVLPRWIRYTHERWPSAKFKTLKFFKRIEGRIMKAGIRSIINLALVAGAMVAGTCEIQAQTRTVQIEAVPTVRVEPHGHSHVRPTLGFYPVDSHCLEVLRVIHGSYADRIGLERGDRIVSINGTRVHNPRDLSIALEDAMDFNAGRVRIVIDNVRARRGEYGASRYVTKTVYMRGSRPSGRHDDHHHHHHHD